MVMPLEHAQLEKFWREKGNLSKALILLELSKGNSKFVDIGKNLGLTAQAVSFYAKELQKDRFIDSSSRVTVEGKEFLQKFLASMGSFLSKAYQDSGIVLTCEAIAAEPLNKGERVYLYLGAGDLYATKRQLNSSTGITLDNAKPGEALRVGNLSGIMEIKVGKFFMIKTDLEFCREKKNLEKIEEFIKKNDVKKIFVFGTIAKVFAKKMDLNPYEFAPVEGAFEACARGFNSLLIFSPEMVKFTYLKISENVDKYGIYPQTVEI
jgi:predicted transcriptional regulator